MQFTEKRKQRNGTKQTTPLVDRPEHSGGINILIRPTKIVFLWTGLLT